MPKAIQNVGVYRQMKTEEKFYQKKKNRGKVVVYIM